MQYIVVLISSIVHTSTRQPELDGLMFGGVHFTKKLTFEFQTSVFFNCLLGSAENGKERKLPQKRERKKLFSSAWLIEEN